jgi:hypothetical protein
VLKPLVTGISLANFRGIGDQLDLDFGIGGSPVSVIISGDNGSGKSSIVDGVEFALLGRLLSGTRRVALSHLGGGSDGGATVTLSDGELVVRDIPTGHDSGLGNKAHPAYALSPFVLRRPDIVQFFDYDETERQLALANFFRSGTERADTEDRLESQRAHALRSVSLRSQPIGPSFADLLAQASQMTPSRRYAGMPLKARTSPGRRRFPAWAGA